MSRIINLIGQRFGKLQVVSRSDKASQSAHWNCICDCGSTSVVSSSNLRFGNTTSCGCFHKLLMSQKFTKDLSGMSFGRLTVVCRSSKRKGNNVYWTCRCDCGAMCETSGHRLRSLQTQSCGCLQKERTSQASVVDRTGQQFGRLTVIRRVHYESKATKWLCQCSCGNETVVTTGSLQSNNTTSCGCVRKESVSNRYLIDLTGRVIGNWTVIKRAPQNRGHFVFWECQHKNGTIKERSAQTLLIEDDPIRSFIRTCRCRILASFKKHSICKLSHASKLLGCTGAELVEHLRKQFYGSMTAENHGDVWHIDHIIPIASFDLSDPEQVAQCFHHSNLQPLLIEHNLSKSNRVDWKHPITQAIEQGI